MGILEHKKLRREKNLNKEKKVSTPDLEKLGDELLFGESESPETSIPSPMLEGITPTPSPLMVNPDIRNKLAEPTPVQEVAPVTPVAPVIPKRIQKAAPVPVAPQIEEQPVVDNTRTPEMSPELMSSFNLNEKPSDITAKPVVDTEAPELKPEPTPFDSEINTLNSEVPTEMNEADMKMMGIVPEMDTMQAPSAQAEPEVLPPTAANIQRAIETNDVFSLQKYRELMNKSLEAKRNASLSDAATLFAAGMGVSDPVLKRLDALNDKGYTRADDEIKAYEAEMKAAELDPSSSVSKNMRQFIKEKFNVEIPETTPASSIKGPIFDSLLAQQRTEQALKLENLRQSGRVDLQGIKGQQTLDTTKLKEKGRDARAAASLAERQESRKSREQYNNQILGVKQGYLSNMAKQLALGEKRLALTGDKFEQSKFDKVVTNKNKVTNPSPTSPLGRTQNAVYATTAAIQAIDNSDGQLTPQMLDLLNDELATAVIGRMPPQGMFKAFKTSSGQLDIARLKQYLTNEPDKVNVANHLNEIRNFLIEFNKGRKEVIDGAIRASAISDLESAKDPEQIVAVYGSDSNVSADAVNDISAYAYAKKILSDPSSTPDQIKKAKEIKNRIGKKILEVSSRRESIFKEDEGLKGKSKIVDAIKASHEQRNQDIKDAALDELEYGEE